MQLALSNNKDFELFSDSVQPLREIAAYEALWADRKVNFRRIAEFFARHPGKKPSELISEDRIDTVYSTLRELMERSRILPNILINHTYNYPSKLRDAREPVEILYYSGNLNLLYDRSVAVVGSRRPTEAGLQRTRQLVKRLVEDKITVVSGLAEGVDTEAHKTAISSGGKTVAVIGTPLNEYYPKQNMSLQDLIAEKYLLVSQVPYLRYQLQDFRQNRFFFPERNKTMSALTEATIIVEASETSGTLIQARAALHQKRKLFILDSCFKNPQISWPKRFELLGAIRVRSYDDIRSALGLR